MRENEFTNNTNQENSNNIHNDRNNIANNENNEVNTNLLINRESSLHGISNFNLGVYSEFTGNNFEAISDSAYMNRNFESHLDEIFDNLTYLITTEKY